MRLTLKTGTRVWTVDSVTRTTESRSCFGTPLLHVTYVVSASSPWQWSGDAGRETIEIYFRGQANCTSTPRSDGSMEPTVEQHRLLVAGAYRDGRSYGPFYALRAEWTVELEFTGRESAQSRTTLARALTRKLGATVKARNLAECTPCEAVQFERALKALKVDITGGK